MEPRAGRRLAGAASGSRARAPRGHAARQARAAGGGGMKARGRLIAVDGSGASLGAAAKTLTAALRREREGSGVSSWDSSGIFTELESEEDRKSTRLNSSH